MTNNNMFDNYQNIDNKPNNRQDNNLKIELPEPMAMEELPKIITTITDQQIGIKISKDSDSSINFYLQDDNTDFTDKYIRFELHNFRQEILLSISQIKANKITEVVIPKGYVDKQGVYLCKLFLTDKDDNIERLLFTTNNCILYMV